MSSPKPKTWAVALMAVISAYFVYVMSLGIGKFDNCHTGAEDEHLRWRKDYLHKRHSTRRRGILRVPYPCLLLDCR